jgi:YidC/Oxa1 family membrane protein insertase
MDQKRLLIAIALSLAILLGFQYLLPKPPVKLPPQASSVPAQTTGATTGAPTPAASAATAAATAAMTAQGEAEKNAPRISFTGPKVEGSVNLLGARIDDVVLRDYHDTVEPTSPLVRVLEPRSSAQPYYVQFGWTAPPGVDVKLPGNDTVWTAHGTLSGTSKLTLTWNNGAGLDFAIELGLDDNYLFTAVQRVTNASGAPVSLYPFERIRRDYTPVVSGYYLLHEGLIGVLDGKLKEMKYTEAKSEGDKKQGLAFDSTGAGGWAGFTDKYWLTALIPDQSTPTVAAYRYIADHGDHYQVDFVTKDPQTVAPGATVSDTTHVFAGAKEVHLLAAYEKQLGAPKFDYAVDWGWFFFITKPFFYAIDWLNGLLGNFGLAIMVFTLGLKALFFPLANKSYRSMSKMKLLAPKMTALKAEFKDDPKKLQTAMMQLYKAEKVNPASGCLPMLIQIPVFFSLYKVIFVTIEMRQAPFFGWIHDLSAVDPTNVFNLFGLLPFDPSIYSHYLHMGAWPLIMGCTMFFQQKLNPPPPDPVQAKLFQFMPIIFTFMLASFPAGLVIYWSWNNSLTILQQWLIMRSTRLSNPKAARVITQTATGKPAKSASKS